MESLIECNGLRHAYGRKPVLHGLTFSVEAGGIFGLLGKTVQARALSSIFLWVFYALQEVTAGCSVRKVMRYLPEFVRV